MGEGYVGDTDGADKDWDGPHLKTGLHYSRLAMDLNLFVGGVYQDRNGPEFEALGQHWESLDPLCRWGGRFNDPNHFSITWDGKA